MKRIICSFIGLLLLVGMVLSMCGCGPQTEFEERPLKTTQPTEPEPVLPAYEAMVKRGFVGNAEEFVTLLAYEIQGNGSAYKALCDRGYTGTMRKWYEDLLGHQITGVLNDETGYEMAVLWGFEGTAEEWVNSLIPEDAGFRIMVQEIKPSFAILDDDGKGKFEYMYEWAVENQVPVTAAIITQYLDVKSGWLTKAKVLEMYNSGLVTFASHTQNHTLLDKVDPETMEAELSQSKADIEAMGIPCDILAYPGGRNSDEVVQVVKKYYKYAFLAGGNSNDAGMPVGDRVNYPKINTYRLYRVRLDGDFTEENGGMAYVREQIDNAIANDGMVVFMTHAGSTDMGGGVYLDPAMDLAVYTETVEYIRSKGFDIEPLLTVCDRFQNPVEIIYE